MVNVADKWTTNDILARLNCHRTTVLRVAEKLNIIPDQVGNVFLFDKADAERIIAELKGRKSNRSK